MKRANKILGGRLFQAGSKYEGLECGCWRNWKKAKAAGAVNEGENGRR